ncbi:MAG: hypothetical protein PHC34_13565, partial [Candidatus Gastranaerophilales bacterium]|nr:hypothetical protein [Candidatus Gastranaerophilales bacterium]
MSISVNFKTFGKYLDQPALVKGLYSTAPLVLSTGATGYGLYDIYKSPKKERKNKLIQNFSILLFTVSSALIATRGLKIKGKQIFEGLIELPHLHKNDLEEVLTKVSDNKLKKLINKVKDEKILKLPEVKYLADELENKFKGKNFISKIIPDSHNHNPFEELGKLSLLGLIPVFGGITGGIVGDKLTKQDWKKKLPDKIKEGSYQYLNNIFLCNVGAGIALLSMNKFNVKSKAIRFGAMLTGVIGVGLVAGSAIANFIGKNFINPAFDKNTHTHKQHNFYSMFKDLNDERHPEVLDVSLHIDDIASVGFISGFKWIGPVLP